MSPTPKGVNAELEELYRRPGFLLRRAHQIAVGLFIEECRSVQLTPPQHGVLIAVARSPGVTQAELARLIGFDRATVGQVVEGLVRRKLLRRQNAAVNRRAKSLSIAPAGTRLLKDASKVLHRTSERLLSPLKPVERTVFLELLVRLTNDLNSVSRTPLHPGSLTSSQKRKSSSAGIGRAK